MEADIRVQQAELEKDTQLQMMKAQQARELAVMKGELDLLKHRENCNLSGKSQLEAGELSPFTAGHLYDGT